MTVCPNKFKRDVFIHRNGNPGTSVMRAEQSHSPIARLPATVGQVIRQHGTHRHTKLAFPIDIMICNDRNAMTVCPRKFKKKARA